MNKLVVLLGFLMSLSLMAKAEVIEMQYEGYRSWIDCDAHSVVRVEYLAKADVGDLTIAKNFKFDPNIPERCRQFSTSTYKVPGEESYHRGHQVTMNHLDYSIGAMKESNFITANILPQTSELNTQSWRESELYVECQRDAYKDANRPNYGVWVTAGPLYIEGETNTKFLHSHGIVTPSHFWKVTVAGDRDSIDEVKAWIMPNSHEATREKVDSYLVSVDDVENATGLDFNLSEEQEKMVATQTKSTIRCSYK
jgi:endonuclease G, mitochondrial